MTEKSGANNHKSEWVLVQLKAELRNIVATARHTGEPIDPERIAALTAAPAASEGEDGAVFQMREAGAGRGWEDIDRGRYEFQHTSPAHLQRYEYRALYTRPAAQVAATSKHDERSEAFKMLVAVARAAHRAMDSGEEFADNRVMLEASGATELAHALDAMDALPDVPDPNYVYDGWARAAYFAAQSTPKHDEGRETLSGLAAEVRATADDWTRRNCPGNGLMRSFAESLEAINAAALATQPAARRVTDENVEKSLAAYWSVFEAHGASTGADGAAMRAALESFAQSGAVSSSTSSDLAAEGVSE